MVFTGNPHCKQCPPVLLLLLLTPKFCLHEEQGQKSSCHQICEICLKYVLQTWVMSLTSQPGKADRRKMVAACGARTADPCRTQKTLSSPPCTVQSELKDGLNSAKHSNFCLSARMERKTQISLNGRAELEPLAREVPVMLFGFLPFFFYMFAGTLSTYIRNSVAYCINS